VDASSILSLLLAVTVVVFVSVVLLLCDKPPMIETIIMSWWGIIGMRHFFISIFLVAMSTIRLAVTEIDGK
jgi:uncharacterized Tic20 family protein